jgi:hypothetical protein
MRFPLHRSLVFWTGLLAIAFLGWAWREARTGPMHTLYYGGNPTWGLLVHSSFFALNLEKNSTLPESPAPKGIEYGTARAFPEQELLFPPFGRMSYTDRDKPGVKTTIWQVPYWAFIAGVSLLWLALLVWRWRRWRLLQHLLKSEA